MSFLNIKQSLSAPACVQGLRRHPPPSVTLFVPSLFVTVVEEGVDHVLLRMAKQFESLVWESEQKKKMI